MLYSDYTAEQNAENSYFSVAAIVAAVSEYIPNEESLQLLEESLKSYYIPAFVLNVTANYVTITVHPLHGEKTTIQMSRVEGSSPELVSSQPSSSSNNIIEQFEEISPQGHVISVELNPASKTDSPIKRPLGLELNTEEADDWLSKTYGWQPIENLLTCNFPFDPTGAQDQGIISNLRSKLQIICDVVASQIEGLDPDVRDSVVENYKSWESKINSLTELLSDISEQQQEVIKLLNIESLMTSYFPLGDGEEISTSTKFNDILEDLWKTLSNIFTMSGNNDSVVLNRFSDLYEDGDLDSGGTILSSLIPSNGYSFGSQLGFISSGDSVDLIPIVEEKAYRNFLELYINESSTILERYSALKGAPLSDLDSTTVLDWYTEEIDALMTDKDSVGSAKTWISSNESSLETMKALLDLDITAGSGHLYNQCFLKAIQDLIDSNVDITDYLGKDAQGESWLDLVGQSGTVGLTKFGIAPNLTLDEKEANETAIENGQDAIYSEPVEINDTKYINFNLLLYILRAIKPSELYKIIEDTSSPGTINENHSGLIAVKEEFLNSGDLESRSNGCFFNLGDILRSDNIGGLPVHPVVTKSSNAAEFFQFTDLSSQGVHDNHRLWRHLGGLPNGSDEYFLPFGNWQRGALLNAETVMGINYHRQSDDGQVTTENKGPASFAFGTQKGGQNSRYGIIDFHTVSEVDYTDDSVYNQYAFDASQNLTFEEAHDTGFNNESSGFLINNFREGDRKVISIFEAPSETLDYFANWYRNYIDNTRYGMATTLQGNFGGKVIPTGLLTGMIAFSRDTSEGVDSAPSFVDYTQDLTNDEGGGRSTDIDSELFRVGWYDNLDPEQVGQYTALWDPYGITDEYVAGGTNQILQYFWGPFARKWPERCEYPIRDPDRQDQWVRNQQGLNAHLENDKIRHTFGLDVQGNFEWVWPLEWRPIAREKWTAPPTGFSIFKKPERDLARAEQGKTDLGSMKDYLMMKGGGALRAFGIFEGIMKALYRRTHEHLLTALNEITGENLNYDNFLSQGVLENDELLNNWIHVFQEVMTKLEQIFDMQDWQLRVNYDGKFVLIDENLYGGSNRGVSVIDAELRSKYTDTVGDGNRTLVKNYAKFKSMTSVESKLTRVKESDLHREYDWANVFPIGILATSANAGYTGGHGLPSYYANVYSNSFLRDPMRYTESNFQDVGSLSSSVSNPYGSHSNSGLINWMRANKLFAGTRYFLDEVTQPMEDFIEYIEDLSIEDTLKEVYQEGLLTVDDIANSTKILQLVNSNVEKYSPDENGISQRWKSLSDDYSDAFAALVSTASSIVNNVGVDGKWFLCHLGISENFIQWTLGRNASLYVGIDDKTSGWDGVNMGIYGMYLPIKDGTGLKRRAIKINNGTFSVVNSNKVNDGNIDLDLSSKILSQWTHFVKGFDLDESTFVERYEQIYSEFLQNNDAGIFPWSSDDFEDGKPIRELESIYNVSSWLFPKNYFMEIIKPRDFRKIIPVLVYVPVDEAGEFLGNIKFKIYTGNSPLWVESGS